MAWRTANDGALFIRMLTPGNIRVSGISQSIPPVEVLPTRDGYDRWAAIYDDEGNPLVALETPIVHSLLGDVRDLHIADLGCGTGRHALWLAAAGARVTAVDFSGEMLGRARAKRVAAGEQTGVGAVTFIEHDLNHPLPLPSAAFDRVLSGLVIDHIPDLVAFYGEIRRILRPGGLTVLSVMHPAMMLRGVQARFTDPATGLETRPRSIAHQISDYVMAAVRAGLSIDQVSEHAPDAALAAEYPRAAKYVGWPLLLVMTLSAPGRAR